jgi:hypothetical protein
MAHPADSGPKAPGAFAHGRLSPEDADRLAAMFRPSWELDDAPFSGPGTLEPSEIRALQGGGVHAEVRAVAQSQSYATNGAHAPPPATTSGEPEDSVVIDRSITAQDIAPTSAPRAVQARPTNTVMGMAPPPAVQAVQPAPPPAPAVPASLPPAPVASKPPPPSQRPKAPQFTVGPPTPPKARPVSVDLEAGYPKKSKTPLYAGLGVGGVALLALVIWAVSGSSSSDKSATPAPTTTQTVEDKLAAVPPPPPPTTPPPVTAAATATTPPPATTVAAAPPAPAPVPQTAVTALPTAAPVPTHAAAYVAPRTYGGGGGAARPAGKSGKATIVRDVPF